MAEPPRIRVYVDGFNLYYGCLQGTPYRWLNVVALGPGMGIVRPERWAPR